jgi:hypothetical protein
MNTATQHTFDTTKWASEEFRNEILRRVPLEFENTQRWIEVSWDIANGEGTNVLFMHGSSYRDPGKKGQFDNIYENGTLTVADFTALNLLVREELGNELEESAQDVVRVEANFLIGESSSLLHFVAFDAEGDEVYNSYFDGRDGYFATRNRAGAAAK